MAMSKNSKSEPKIKEVPKCLDGVFFNSGVDVLLTNGWVRMVTLLAY